MKPEVLQGYPYGVLHKLPCRGSWLGKTGQEDYRTAHQQNQRPALHKHCQAGNKPVRGCIPQQGQEGGAGPSHPPGAAEGLEELCSAAS